VPTLPPIHRWLVASPRGLVHVVHGMLEHGGRYGRLAAALNAERLSVWAHDHRGHGINPEPGLPGHFADRDGWRVVVDDTRAVSEAMQAEQPGLPLVLFAHSMGSFIGQTLIGTHPHLYRAAILSGTNGAPGFQEGIARTTAHAQRLFGARRPGRVVDRLVLGSYNLRFSPTRTRADWLSRDAAEVDRYLADPLNRFVLTSQAWVDFLDGKATLGTPGQLATIRRDLPLLLWSGARDPVGEASAGVTRLRDACRSAGMSGVEVCLYPEARHEMLNEVNRDDAIADVVAWLRRALA
jgi:alpha-beta hydrolase superfamily lysophospholipase